MAFAELAAPERTRSAWSEIRCARLLQASIIVALLLVVFGVPLTGVALDRVPFCALMFWKQDVYLAPLLLATCLLRPVSMRGAAPSRSSTIDRPAIPILITLLLVLVCWAGHCLVFGGYSLSRDEAMSSFDTFVYAHGRFVWPFPEQWRAFSTALNPTFILPIGDHDAWISTYLPMNSAVRAIVGTFADVWLTGPLFVGIGALALWRITLRLWPESASTRLVALLLYAGSAQVVITGMTAYAMSAHLGLDLIWLWLFLRDDKPSHAGAIAVGFIATGLHQPLFHPLFAAPIVFEVLKGQSRWRLLAVYAVAYGLIGIFWLSWPNLITIGFSKAPQVDDVGYLTRLLVSVDRFDLKTIWIMACNLLRFLTWQHICLLPLLILGTIVGRRNPLAASLAIGLGLPIAVMAIIMPVQGQGWGYRYVHGVIGNACLLGAYGWHWLESRGLSMRRAFLWTSVVTFLGLPVHAAMARRMAEPYASAAAKIAATDADIVVIDHKAAPYAADLIINQPDLANRPIRLASEGLRQQDLEGLCRTHSLAFVGESDLLAIKDMWGKPRTGDSPSYRALKAAARQVGCTIVSSAGERSPPR